jgi:ketosteroid isomerase-like protein
MRHTKGSIVLLAAASVVTWGCNRSTSATADSATPAATSSTSASATFDRTAARAEILAADSAFVRALMAKNVDSLMPYYDESVVSMSEGGKAVKGLADVRGAYNQAIKSNPRGLTFQSAGVNFSDDGTMAWDYGTVTSIANDAKGKAVQSSGNFLNVWKRVGGHYRIVAEIGNSDRAAP